MSGARAWREASKEKEKGRVETTKVKRYRPGRVPEWMAPEEEEESVVDAFTGRGKQVAKQDTAPLSVLVRKSNMEASVHQLQRDIEQRQIKRPERQVIAPSILKKGNQTTERGPRVVSRPTVVSRSDEQSRAELKERLMQSKGDTRITSSESEGTDDSDYTSEEDSSEDDAPVAKPMFVRKSDRKTLDEREALEKEELEKIEQEKIRKARQAQETKKIAAEKIAAEKAQEEAKNQGPQGLDDVVTDDEMAPEEDYRDWEEREIERLRRHLEETLKQDEEARERGVWKNMSDEEKQRYLARKTKSAKESVKEKLESKKSWSFLQKYYHKGAFFQSEAEYKGEDAPLVGNLKEKYDFSMPTGEDVFDRNLLPSVMKVRNFGKRSRSKWTHLAQEDTTSMNDR
jgi:microfibrillar-associated protein 1